MVADKQIMSSRGYSHKQAVWANLVGRQLSITYWVYNTPRMVVLSPIPAGIRPLYFQILRNCTNDSTRNILQLLPIRLPSMMVTLRYQSSNSGGNPNIRMNGYKGSTRVPVQFLAPGLILFEYSSYASRFTIWAVKFCFQTSLLYRRGAVHDNQSSAYRCSKFGEWRRVSPGRTLSELCIFCFDRNRCLFLCLMDIQRHGTPASLLQGFQVEALGKQDYLEMSLK